LKFILNNVTQDLQLAGYSTKTVEAYSYHVKKFLDHFDKEPAVITEYEIKPQSFNFHNDQGHIIK
jgi:hypothetical protein